MSEARDEILAALAARAPATAPEMPNRARPVYSGDLVEGFLDQWRAAGGEARVAEDEALETALADIGAVREAEHLWSTLSSLPPRGAGLSPASKTALASLQTAVIPGALGVAECGAVWHWPSGPLERAAALLAEDLVVVLPRREVVGRLFEAYARIELERADRFGWFLAGPSKTADIEQALVLGAHGPKRATLVLTEPRARD